MKVTATRIAIAAAALMMALPASADIINNLYQVGSTVGGFALDPLGNPISGVPIISWTDTIAGTPSGPYLLSILAEGIDGGPGLPSEFDGVYVNGTFVGFLTQQGFYSPLFNLQPGPGALAGVTAETLSSFDVGALLLSGVNTFEVRVDPNNWVNEIEVATLAQTPEPGTLALLGLGLVGLGIRSRRKNA